MTGEPLWHDALSALFYPLTLILIVTICNLPALRRGTPRRRAGRPSCPDTPPPGRLYPLSAGRGAGGPTPDATAPEQAAWRRTPTGAGVRRPRPPQDTA